jgi:hypothetical protein
MQSLVRDPAVGVNFLVLMVTKLSTDRKIEASASVHAAGVYDSSFDRRRGLKPKRAKMRDL